ncbi:molecular chaperone HtpG [uncultured Victivallis sp.]|uniref:molecular chaperone HtpG n=1 Tax=uncultured Victivallis sp. TaxID=354118 RepID=UPI00345A0E0D
MMGETREFKTEVRQLLDLMIHSLYSNRDIFLRELVANAADAIDKARFESLTHPEMAKKWEIRITPDKKAKTLTISDNGIGMTQDEVVENIGTIAKSGTRAFLKLLEEQGSKKEELPELIGQFGVGFYSAFMVAGEVVIVTKKAGSDAPAVRWSSRGEGEYELDSAEKSEPGTEITLHLKEDAEQYLESWKLSGIIHKYSDFIEYPIVMPEVKVNEDKTETVTDRVLNSQKAIWLRKPSEITEEEYKSFYSHLSNFGGTEYLKAIHLSAEGTSEFKALLFLPKQAPFNLLMPDLQKRGLQLYVRRVFITDECKELIPDYLRFVCGVVDSNDLPLNVSREILQENPQLARIEKAVTAKVLSELKKLLETDREAYAGFFREFGRIFKEGLHTDFTNAEKLKDLVMYESMNTEPGKMITLAEYVAAMPESQKEIYYITGEKRESVASSPALEYFRSKGYDVLFMTDPIDDWIMQQMFQYRKKNFKSIAKGDFEVEGAADMLKAAQEKFAGLVEFLKKALGDKVGEVRFSARLTDSPCCLITEGNALSPHLERLFKAMHQEIPESKRILELNPKHPLIEAMFELSKQSDKAPELEMYAKVLFDQALLTEGSPLPDPAAFAREVTNLLLKGISGK